MLCWIDCTSTWISSVNSSPSTVPVTVTLDGQRVAHAPRHGEHLAEHRVHRAPGEAVLDARAEVDLNAVRDRPSRVREHPQRGVGGLRALLHAEREPAAAGEGLEELEVGVAADRHRVEPHRLGQAVEALDEPVGAELAHRGRAVADVDDGAVALRIEERGGGGDRLAEVGGAARRDAREAVQERLHPIGRGRPELGRLALDDGADGEVGADHRDPIVLAEVRGERLDHAAAELEVAAVGRRGDVREDHEVDLLVRGARERRREDEREVEVVALVGLVGHLGRVRRARWCLVRRGPRALQLALAAHELEPEIGARAEVGAADAHRALLDDRAHPGADADRARLGDVGGERELLDVRRARAAAHRVSVHPRGAARGRAEPLGVADHDAARGAGLDRVDARAVAPRRVPLEQRGILGGAPVDLRLVGGAGLRLLPDVAVDEALVAIDGEALQHGALGDADAVEALDGLRRGVEEELIDLGDREVAIDPDADVEAPHDERPARETHLVGDARLERAHAFGAAGARRPGSRQAARPVVPEGRGLDARALAEGELLAARRDAALLSERPAHLAPDDVDQGLTVAGADREGGVAGAEGAVRGGEHDLLVRLRLDEDAAAAEGERRAVVELHRRRLVEEELGALIEGEPTQPAFGDGDRLGGGDARDHGGFRLSDGRPATDGDDRGHGVVDVFADASARRARKRDAEGRKRA